MTNVQVSVGLWWEPSDDAPLVFFCFEVRLYNLFDKVNGAICFAHVCLSSLQGKARSLVWTWVVEVVALTQSERAHHYTGAL